MHIEEITNKIHSMSLEEKVGQLNQAGLWDFELLCEEVRKGARRFRYPCGQRNGGK